MTASNRDGKIWNVGYDSFFCFAQQGFRNAIGLWQLYASTNDTIMYSKDDDARFNVDYGPLLILFKHKYSLYFIQIQIAYICFCTMKLKFF